MKYWITHPNLTPGHDHQIEALALADWQRSGWRIRDDQTDGPVDLTPADPRSPVDEDVDDTETPARDEPDHIDDTKGEV